MKDISYAITTTLLIILAMVLVNVVWGAEINTWMETYAREAKMKDLFYLGLILTGINSFSRPHNSEKK